MYEYAKISDLEKRYHALVGTEAVRAQALLEDATAFIVAELQRNNIDPDPSTWDEAYSQAVVAVICAMVKRSLISSDSGDVQSESASVGVYSQSFTYANPTGDLYLKESERRLLGIQLHKQRITSILPMTLEDHKEVENEV